MVAVKSVESAFYMRKAFSEWYSEYYQEPLCERFSPDTVKKMMKITEESADYYVEMGAPIYEDYTLGDVATGGKYKVKVAKPEGTLGSYHTHPFGLNLPSGMDILEMMANEDRIGCIGRGGYFTTSVNCYTPIEDRDWVVIKGKVFDLVSRIEAYNSEMETKYPEKKGDRLLKYLRRKDFDNWKRHWNMMREKSRLAAEAGDKWVATPGRYKATCTWERPVERYIRGGIIIEEEEE